MTDSEQKRHDDVEHPMDFSRVSKDYRTDLYELFSCPGCGAVVERQNIPRHWDYHLKIRTPDGGSSK